MAVLLVCNHVSECGHVVRRKNTAFFGRYLHRNGIQVPASACSGLGGQYGRREVNIFEGERSSTIRVSKELCEDVVVTITYVDSAIPWRGRFRCLSCKILLCYS